MARNSLSSQSQGNQSSLWSLFVLGGSNVVVWTGFCRLWLVENGGRIGEVGSLGGRSGVGCREYNAESGEGELRFAGMVLRISLGRGNVGSCRMRHL